MPETDTLFERSRSAWSRLQALVRTRSAGETIIAEAFAAASADAEKEIGRARKQLMGARKKQDAELAAEYEANTAAIHTRCTTGEAETEATRRKFRKKTTDQYSTKLQTLRSDYEDKRWTVDSLREAGDKEAEQRYDKHRREIAYSGKRIDEFWAEAEPVFRQVRLNRGEVEFRAGRLPAPIITDPIGKMQKALEDAEYSLATLRQATLFRLVRPGPTLLMFSACGLLGAALSFPVLSFPMSLIFTLGWLVLGGLFLRVLLGILAKRQIRDRGRGFGVFQAEASRALAFLTEHAEATYAKHTAEVGTTHEANRKRAAEIYEPRIATMERQLASTLQQIETNAETALATSKETRVAELAAEDARYTSVAEDAAAKQAALLAEAEATYAAKVAAATSTRDVAWDKLTKNWFGGLAAVQSTADDLTAFGAEHFPPWEQVAQSFSTLAKVVPPGIRFGALAVDQYALPDGLPFDTRLVPAEPIAAIVPAYLPFPDRAAVMIKAADAGRGHSVLALQAMMLRFLTGLPPGKVRFTVIDPVGLGENFGSFMHLADYDENLITSRIWTEPIQIEKRLADLTEHMENVIQKYLRNQYKSIEDYNRAAGEVAEPYRVLVIANFPVNFTSEAARRLISIMSSGPACGVCTLLSVDTRAELPRDFRFADLEQVAFVLEHDAKAGKYLPKDEAFRPFPLVVDAPPSPEVTAAIVARIGKAGKNAARVEVPFDFIMPAKAEHWRGNASKGFDIPIGRAGATRRQLFSVGMGTAQHALVAGKTGSGKSTLLHALITNMALLYSPDEAELYLIDFKKGVEFKAYAEAMLPHARVIAIESEREFGVSVLQRLDGILRERGDRYRDAGTNDLAGYRAWLKVHKPGTVCPRILLIVDEFQEFFVEDDKLAQEAALLMDRLVRQGRAFGVHVLLGSQTLGGAYSLARSTIDQMAVRIALQCSEADAQLILSKDNTAARLLNRPGEAIYNDANGMVEGNDPFQVVWLSEDRRSELLEELRHKGGERTWPAPLVFEGSSTAEIGNNAVLTRLLHLSKQELSAGPPVAFLGDPIAIKEPTTVTFRPQSATNLLMLGQHEDAAIGMMLSCIVSLRAKLRPKLAEQAFTIVDGTPEDSEFAPYLKSAVESLGLQAGYVTPSGIAETLANLTAEMDARRAGERPKTARFLFVQGLHRLRELRKADEDFGFGRKDKSTSPGEQFAALLREGPPLGIHVVAWCDSLTNLNRAVDRAGLREFSFRVLFQMSPTDSSQLIDTPAASRLGRHRALFVEEGSERPEKFRPYGLPTQAWLAEATAVVAEPAGEPA